MKRITLQALGVLFAMAAIGCTDVSPSSLVPAEEPNPSDSPAVREGKALTNPSLAGNPLPPATDTTNMWTTLVHGRGFTQRPDPFALQPRERSYEVAQTSERLFGTMNGFRLDFTPEPTTVVLPVIEPQPYRRLAGVIVGDSVLALIDMGDGQLKLIRPGQDIDGWHVASIDSDQAVLTRTGNKLPKRVVVRLESPMIGGGGGGAGRPGNAGQGGQGGAGAPTGGPPGLSPGGIGGG